MVMNVFVMFLDHCWVWRDWGERCALHHQQQ